MVYTSKYLSCTLNAEWVGKLLYFFQLKFSNRVNKWARFSRSYQEKIEELKFSFKHLHCFSSDATASWGWSILVTWLMWTHPHFLWHYPYPDSNGFRIKMMLEREYLRFIESFEFAENIRLPFSVWTGIDTTHTRPTYRKCNETYFNQYWKNPSSCKSLLEITF